MVTAYVKDMFQFFREQEHRAVISPYLGGDDAIQSIINERMRSILVDWLVEIHIGMKCDPATLYLSVQIIDRFLASESPSNKATKKNLQLIGTSAFFIASKYEQIYPVSLRDLVYVCDHVYSEDDVSFLLLFTLILLSTKKLPLTSFFFCIILFCRSFRWKQLFSRL
jgi:cyclin B